MDALRAYPWSGLLVVVVAACAREPHGASDGGAGTDAARAIDGAPIDGAIADAASPPDAGPPPDAAPPDLLSGRGLYADIASKTLAAEVVAYVPSYELWADGATKQRWYRLPPGGVIDTSDMDHWVFPVGTRFYKEFQVAGQRIETRVIERTGAGPFDYSFMAYVWAADESDAIATPSGLANANGTSHDVPNVGNCLQCHSGERGRVLGFSAIQLSRSGPGVTLAQLVTDGVLSAPPAADADLAPPGPPGVAAALGYLHANCGHCHSADGDAGNATSMRLRLDVADRTPESTTTYLTAVGVLLDNYSNPSFTLRIAPGDPSQSALFHRLSVRGDSNQMPPLASEVVDADGQATVSAWISGLPP